MVDYPKDWEEVRLGDLLITYGGLTGKSNKDFIEGNKKYISYLNVFNNVYIDKVDNWVWISPNEIQNKVEKGDIIFTQSSETIEEIGMASAYVGDEEVYLNSFCFGAKKKRDADSIFLVFLFRSKEIRKLISKEGQGSTRYNLSPMRLMNITITIPPLPEQQAIADTLSAFDEHLDNLERLIEKKKQIRDGALEDLMSGKTRLEGFNGEWEEVRLGEVLAYTQPSNYIESDFLEKGSIPVLTAGKTFVLGYSNSKEKAYENLPTILFDDFTTDVKFITFPFMVKSSATKFLNLKSENYSLKYLYYLLLNFNYSIQSHERHWISKFAKFKITIPPLPEQQAIADILTAMDEEIGNLEKEKEKIGKIKEGAMEDLLTGKIRLK